MPKMKTHRGAAKRFDVTATGKVKRKMAFHSHILGHKTTKRKRTLRKGTYLCKADTPGVLRMLPYKN